LGVTGATTLESTLGVTGNSTLGGTLAVASNLAVDTNTLFVDSVANRVGIGKTDPVSKLDVVGSIRGNHLTLGTELHPTIGGNWININHSTFHGSIGPNHPNPEGGIIFANRSSTNIIPWGMYMGVVKDSATSSATSLRLDLGRTNNLNSQLSSGGDNTITPILTIRQSGNVGIGSTDPGVPLDVVGATSISGNLAVAGGLITNTGGVAKKTYSFTGALTNGQTIANSTIKITFSAHVFYAKIVAHLIESDNEVSTLSMECGGGHRLGGTPLAIAKGPVSIFGSASTNPWDSVVAVTTTTVALAPTTNMAAAGNYNIFIEYISAHASGVVTKITEGSTDVITFGY
jgi:hypothetical protein